MSKIYEHYMDKKQKELEAAEKELNFKKYEKEILAVRKNYDRGERNLITISRLQDNVSSQGNWWGGRD
jgi:hypothetical protein